MRSIIIIIKAIKAGLNLSDLWHSRTTTNAAQGTGAVAVLAGVIVAQFFGDMSTEAQLGIVAAIVTVIGPVLSRVIAFSKVPEKIESPATPDIEHGGVLVRSVSHDGKAWTIFHGTLLDAHLEGWRFAIDLDGIQYSAQTGHRYTYSPDKAPDL